MSTHVTVLGAAGVIGGAVVEHLASSRPDLTITASDVDESAADRLADAGSNVRFEAADVTDPDDLDSVLRDADLVVNCVGPFYRFATAVLERAIETGTDYVDVCDDYAATEPLLEYHERAVAADVVAVVGLGASPGVTNVLVARGAAQLDSVEVVAVSVTRSILSRAGAAIPYHLFHSWLGEVPTYAGGERRTVRGLEDGAESVRFPDPFGEREVYHFGHPESITIPRAFAVERVSVKGTFVPATFRDALRSMHDLGLLDAAPVTVGDVEVEPVDFAAAFLERVGMRVAAEAGEFPDGGAVVVEVEGEADGVPTVHRFAGTSTMEGATSTAAAVGAEFALDGRLEIETGVHPPETAIPPEAYVDRLVDEPGFEFWSGRFEKRA